MSARRTFLKKSAIAGIAATLPLSATANLWAAPPKFKMSLNPGAIGVAMPLKQLINVAATYGYKAVAMNVGAYGKLSPDDKKLLLNLMEVKGISWDAAGLPFQFRESESDFKLGIGKLVYNAVIMQGAGATRMNTWIMPTHNKYTYRENFDLHVNRLGEIANRLLPYDINLGLEYVGPKTLMARDKFSFIRTMDELKELIEAIDMPNVGYQLDAFHWFCTGENVEELKSLKAEQIVTVDLNDAVVGRTADQQLDYERELPGKSGIIDLATFLKALNEIGYDGPIRAEPFNKELAEMDNTAAIAETANWMKRSFVLATD